MAGPVGFVGREGELSRLLGALGGDARLVLVVGDAGAGKARFVTEAMDRAAAAGMVVVRGECLPLAHTFTDKQGFVWLSEEDFVEHFAADVDPARARVMYAVQQALAGSAFTDVMGEPAWKSLPSWYLVAGNDEAIPPEAEKQFAGRMGAVTVEVPSSHVAMVSHPDDVAQLIRAAARDYADASAG